MEIVGRAWNSKYNKKEIYFKFIVGNKDYSGVIGLGRCRLIDSELEPIYVNNRVFKINNRAFKLVKSTVKAYDYKVLME